MEIFCDGAYTLQGAPQQAPKSPIVPGRFKPKRSKAASWVRGIIQLSYGTRGAYGQTAMKSPRISITRRSCLIS